MTCPLLYELNTRCWLRELSAAAGRPLTLAEVPETEFAQWQRLGVSYVWLMGVWTTGPRARAVALEDPQQRRRYTEVLPGWREEDVAGSPYAIADYRVPPALGGEEGLRHFRGRLQAHGLKLVLDFVPNHLGLDHAWVRQRPELFVQSPAQMPDTFYEKTAAGPRWLAHGKDPYFPGWTDTVQLDYRLSATRAAMTELLLSVASRCDGVRCDMAMLLLEDIFARTWERFPVTASAPTTTEHREPVINASNPVRGFWSTAIAATRQARPAFLFLAEAYWGTEPRLQALGFDYTYDKALYDKLVARDAAGVQQHLQACSGGSQASSNSLGTSAHFLENHDEPRIASLLSLPEHRAAALLTLGLPGLRFLHEGQLSGARCQIPVQLGRRALESTQPEIQSMYDQLLTTLPVTAVGQGRGLLLEPRPAWPDNPTARNIVLIQWQSQPTAFDLVAVNLAPHRSQCYAPLVPSGLASRKWSMKDLLGDEQYVRSGPEMQERGLYLDLPPHAAQLFQFQPV